MSGIHTPLQSGSLARSAQVLAGAAAAGGWAQAAEATSAAKAAAAKAQ
jgi:hypothetical protein